jgi:Mn2+/Fe2+ NRAMP family transporter
MIVCFATALGSSGVHVNVLAGLVPLIPEGGSELALAVVGTTAIPINLLLGSSIARSSTVAAMRRGVGLASSLSGFISVLVLLVGTLVPSRPPCVAFKLEDVSHVLEALVGPAGRVMFAMGLFGAGISSALTIPLGTTLALEELFGLRREEAAKPVRGLAGADAAADATADVTTDAITDRPGVLSDLSGRLRWCRWGRHVFLATFLGLSLIPSLLQLPTISIIMTAQIVNGLLLPCVASALLLCLNDARSHMGSARPQPARLNALMFPCVGIALYLASVVLLKRLVAAQASTAMASAVPVAAVGLVLLASCVYVLRRDQPQMLRTVEFATVAAAVSSSPALA